MDAQIVLHSTALFQQGVKSKEPLIRHAFTPSHSRAIPLEGAAWNFGGTSSQVAETHVSEKSLAGNNTRIAKFTKEGVFTKSWGSKGTEPGQFAAVPSLAVDAQANVYAVDSGNHRIQVFDNNGKFKTQITNVGAPAALCLTTGAHPYLYSSNSNPVTDIDSGGEIYKLELDGTVVGKFGRAGKLPKEFATVNEIDCRTPNQLYVAEIGNYRMQKLMLK
jgi:hypothetical protein